MTKIKFKEDCLYGKKEEIKEVNDTTAYVLGLKGHIDVIDDEKEEKPKTIPKRNKVV